MSATMTWTPFSLRLSTWITGTVAIPSAVGRTLPSYSFDVNGAHAIRVMIVGEGADNALSSTIDFWAVSRGGDSNDVYMTQKYISMASCTLGGASLDPSPFKGRTAAARWADTFGSATVSSLLNESMTNAYGSGIGVYQAADYPASIEIGNLVGINWLCLSTPSGIGTLAALNVFAATLRET